MAQNAKSSRIAAAYGELKKFIDGGHYAKIIKTTNKIINDDYKQEEAWKCKVVALIQSDQFKEAAMAISKSPVVQDLQFELAYCQYRLNNVEQSLETLSNSTELNTSRGKELYAQVLYRLEQYEECHGVYKDLVRSTDDDMDMERSANMSAVVVQRVLHSQIAPPNAPSSSSCYEQWYNSGCAALAAGRLKDAHTRLSKSLVLCGKLLKEEGASHEEIDQEQAIIRAQLGYTLQLQGDEKEAVNLYNSVLASKVSDPALLAILHNNVATTSAREPSLQELKKKLKASQTAEVLSKLTSVQRDQLTLNNCILMYQSQQALQEEKSLLQDCNNLLESATCLASMKLSAVLVLAASLSKAGKVDQAVARLHDWVKDHPSNIRLTTFAATQLRLMKSDVSSAIEELSSLPEEDRFRPGVVAALVTLLNNKKQKSSVTRLLDEAVQYHAHSSSSSSSALENLLRRASDLQLKEGNPEAAAAALEQLRISSPATSEACMASLIEAYSQFNQEKAMELSRQLPDLPKEILDADALEASLGPKYFQKAALKQMEEATVVKVGVRVKPRKKKKRKTVLPKNYAPGVQPDPERWLPRWQRKNTGARRKKDRKRDKDVGKGTQGGVGDAADKYDITKNPGQYKSSSQSHHQESAGPRRNMPKRKHKKK